MCKRDNNKSGVRSRGANKWGRGSLTPRWSQGQNVVIFIFTWAIIFALKTCTLTVMANNENAGKCPMEIEAGRKSINVANRRLDTGECPWHGPKGKSQGSRDQSRLTFFPRFRIFGYVLAHTFQKIEKKNARRRVEKWWGWWGKNLEERGNRITGLAWEWLKQFLMGCIVSIHAELQNLFTHFQAMMWYKYLLFFFKKTFLKTCSFAFK